MDLFNLLDIAIGFAYIYLIFSVISSTLTEILSALLKQRSINLKKAVRNLIEDRDSNADTSGQSNGKITSNQISQEVLKHPLISNLSEKGKFPSYIPERNFTLALIDTVKKKTGITDDDPTTVVSLLEGVKQLEKGNVKTLLSNFINDTRSTVKGDDAEQFKALQSKIDQWFKDYMDRVSGWYKRWAQKWTYIFAILITLFFYVDSFLIAKTLYKNDEIKMSFVKEATDLINKEKNKANDKIEEIKQNIKESDENTDIKFECFNKFLEEKFKNDEEKYNKQKAKFEKFDYKLKLGNEKNLSGKASKCRNR